MIEFFDSPTGDSIYFGEGENGLDIYMYTPFRITNLLTNKKVEISIPANSCSKLLRVAKSELLELGKPDTLLLRCSIKADGKTTSENDHIFVRPKELSLPNEDFTFEYKNEEGKHIIYIKAISFLYKMHIRCTNDHGNFSKNFFEMVPGDFVKIEYNPSDNFTKNDKANSLDFKCNSLYGLVNDNKET